MDRSRDKVNVEEGQRSDSEREDRVSGEREMEGGKKNRERGAVVILPSTLQCN